MASGVVTAFGWGVVISAVLTFITAFLGLLLTYKKNKWDEELARKKDAREEDESVAEAERDTLKTERDTLKTERDALQTALEEAYQRAEEAEGRAAEAERRLAEAELRLAGRELGLRLAMRRVRLGRGSDSDPPIYAAEVLKEYNHLKRTRSSGIDQSLAFHPGGCKPRTGPDLGSVGQAPNSSAPCRFT